VIILGVDNAGDLISARFHVVRATEPVGSMLHSQDIKMKTALFLLLIVGLALYIAVRYDG
jgi:hypothetical protein